MHSAKTSKLENRITKKDKPELVYPFLFACYFDAYCAACVACCFI